MVFFKIRGRIQKRNPKLALQEITSRLFVLDYEIRRIYCMDKKKTKVMKSDGTVAWIKKQQSLVVSDGVVFFPLYNLIPKTPNSRISKLNDNKCMN